MAALYTPTLTYDPITDPDGLRATHYQIERSPGDGFIYEAMFDPHTGTATPFYHSDSLIIATAGSFRHEMFCYPGPRASYAVFVGPGNALNDAEKSLLAPLGTFQSLHRGELWGVVAALQTVVRILEKGLVKYGPLRRVIIKTDSEYIAKGGTERMLTWLSRGWIGNGESHIREWDLWEAFLAWLEIVKRTWNVEVLLWWVPAQWNRDAKSLAKEGLKLPPPRLVQTRPMQRKELASSESIGSCY
ncbi:hypothetical protein N8I77_011380 [Diaporthe amygdali]|uniref:ribonuclease H n=1 Tax=Phomopsis amygdali TaxID=1214568 RepID=A0AAD9W061_PHOAM|nr:hypothetical protein N8I77_011380 [Diaporthe amygdali]